MNTPRAGRSHGWTASLLSDSRGSAVIEFALVGPIVMLAVLGTVELALDMIVDASVQIAAQKASRVGLTTTAPATGTRASQARGIVMDVLGRWQSAGATVTIVESAYGSYNDFGTSNYKSGLGGLGELVSYQITVTMPGFSGIPQLLGIPALVFQRNYIVQNEQ